MVREKGELHAMEIDEFAFQWGENIKSLSSDSFFHRWRTYQHKKIMSGRSNSFHCYVTIIYIIKNVNLATSLSRQIEANCN